MAPTTFTDMSMRKNAASKGIVRTMFDRVIEGRERQVRRYVERNFALHGIDADDATRGTLLDGDAPTR